MRGLSSNLQHYKIPHTMASIPFKVKAAYDYSSAHEDDLNFAEGQIITVTEIEDDDWYVGQYFDASGTSHSGLFPKNFVERYEPAPPPRPSRAKEPSQSSHQPHHQPPPQPKSDVKSPGVQESKLGGKDEPKDADIESAQTPPPAHPKSPEQRPSEPEPAQLQPPPPSEPPTKAVTSTSSSTKTPPPVAQKSSSFRDRIAAFNRPSSGPIAPTKPASLASSGFIKKPFVAPPGGGT